MHTSGSTGRLKGVMVPAAGLWNRFKFGIQVKQKKTEDVILQKTPYTFDVSVPEIWEPLLIGATQVVLGANLEVDQEAVLATLVRGKVTLCHFVPSVLMLFLRNAESAFAAGRQKRPETLRLVQCSGEALMRAHGAKLVEVLGDHIELWNLYGPTEASVEVTYLEAHMD